MAKAKKPVRKSGKKAPQPQARSTPRQAARSKVKAALRPRAAAKSTSKRVRKAAVRKPAAPKGSSRKPRPAKRVFRPGAPAPARALAGGRPGNRTVPPKQPPSAPGQPELKIDNAAVVKGTGKSWAQWCEALDGAGARAMAHSDIARLVFERYRLGPWWAQMVTVGYEQARGLRELHQRAEGYSIGASKTLAAPAERVYAAWNQDAERSRWLGVNLKVRGATPPKSIRLDWSDQRSRVVVLLHPRGAAKTQVAVEHNKLKDAAECARMKTFWAAALERLDAAVLGRLGGAAGGS